MKNYPLFVGAWGCALGISISLVFYGLFLFDSTAKLYTTITIDAGPIVKTIAQEKAQVGEGSISAIRIEELKEWVVRIPLLAMKRSGDIGMVTVLNSGSPTDKAVKLGVIGDSFAEVKEGLEFGEVVVLKIQHK